MVGWNGSGFGTLIFPLTLTVLNRDYSTLRAFGLGVGPRVQGFGVQDLGFRGLGLGFRFWAAGNLPKAPIPQSERLVS